MKSHSSPNPIPTPGTQRYRLIPGLAGFLTLAVAFWMLLGINWTAKAAPPSRGIVQPISVNAAGEPGDADSLQAAISNDGRFILFTSLASNLPGYDPLSMGGIYLYDRQNSQMVQISNAPDLEAGWDPVFSGDGRFVFYPSLEALSQDAEVHARVYDRFWGVDDPLWPADSIPLSELSTLLSAADGRYLVTMDPHSGEGMPWFYDRLNDHTFAPTFKIKSGPAAPTASLTLSGDGRTLAFLVRDLESQELEIMVYNRVLATTRRFSTVDLDRRGEIIPLAFDISYMGNTLVVLAGQPGSTPGDVIGGTLFRLDSQNGTFSRIPTQGSPTAFQLSADGNHIAYTTGNAQDDAQELHLLEPENGSDLLVGADILSLEDISESGDSLVYLARGDGAVQVYTWDREGSPAAPKAILAGRVVDTTGHPLALMTVEDGRGKQTRTDGEGIFWLAGEAHGPVQLLAEKEGFQFLPPILALQVESDRYDLSFVYTHDETLAEARKDLGMPYSFERGASGPFHGYAAGYCTDLVLDAYTWGVDFNIQFALEQDFRAHPWHFYRWRDARNAYDMWRFFAYTGQLQPHSQPYQPGDIVFFDWSEDGEIDHVAIVSEVNNRNRPRKLLDATGVITANPSGLAAELPWEDIHERTARGFARWSGRYQPVILDDPGGSLLQAALGGSVLVFWIIDSQGDLLSADAVEIPTGRFLDLVWEQSLSLESPVDPYYLLVIHNPGTEPQPYTFTAQFLEDGLVEGRVETRGSLDAGAFQRFPLLLDAAWEPGAALTLGNPVHRIEGHFKDQ